MYQYKKHHRSCPNGMIDSVEFFLLTVVFLQSFTLFLFFFCPLLFESLFVLYTMVFAPLSPSTCEPGVGSFSVLFRPSLNLSTLSCKAACLLFRHHLHINAAKELAGQHLIQRQQYFQIFIIPHPYPLSSICPSPCRKFL